MRAQGPASAKRGRRVLDLRVPATPRVVSRVRQALAEFEVPPVLKDDAQLLASEVVTNSIRHAGLRPEDPIRVRASWSGARLRVEVFDRSEPAGPDPVAGSIRPAPGAESGWGLFLVDRLASRWGMTPGRCWFELELDRGMEARG